MEMQRLFAFLELIHRFQRVDRKVMRPGEERFENDAEHSYQLAMMAWYLNDADRLGMDLSTLLRYALVHDLAEAYAGDTPAYTRDAAERDSKVVREAAAIERISGEFSEFPELIEAIHAYERRDTREAQFIYALDKLLPTLSIYLDGGRSWVREGVTFDMMKSYKAGEIADSPAIDSYFQQLVSRLEKQPGLFPRSLET